MVDDVMAALNFTDQDIQEQLSLLGYHNVPQRQLREFRKDLEELIKHEYSKPRGSSNASSESCGDVVTSYQVSQLRNSSLEQPILATQCTSQQDFSSEKENLLSYKRDIFHGYPSKFHQSDSYSRYTVAPNLCRSTSAPSKLIIQKSPDQESNSSQMQSENSRTSSPETLPESNRRPNIKRKVLRKKNGQFHVYDESTITETESDAGSEFGQNRFQPLSNIAESDTESEEFSSVLGRRPNSAQPFFTKDLWTQKLIGGEGYSCLSNAPKSFIRPIMDHPHTRNLKKTDPVAKYFEYKRNWETFKTPGEKDRKELRWGIREQMLYKSQLPQKPQHIYVPNNYIVPTDKKRSALRWQIRHELANGTIPQKFFCSL
ncbi:centriolar and ciliogenesis-associated protein HYSL1 isoform X1 [Mobula birostris]|uniref:centriolar and ciliogenesis-associated protein HYSL1 isoform X1 n=2 Tax=Mobula birostris TaxID=1983395 RepID=UPI003B281615